jgi:hypothetical protein
MVLFSSICFRSIFIPIGAYGGMQIDAPAIFLVLIARDCFQLWVRTEAFYNCNG